MAYTKPSRGRWSLRFHTPGLFAMVGGMGLLASLVRREGEDDD